MCSLFLVFTSNINSIQSISNLSCVCISQKTWKNNLRVLSEVQAPVECVVSMLPGQWWCRTECNPNPCQYAAQNPRFSRARLLYNTRILCLLPILLNSSHFIAFSRKAFRACWQQRSTDYQARDHG